MKIANMKIGIRLGMAFGVILLLLAGIACVSVFLMAKTKAQIDQITKENNVKIALGNQMLEDVSKISRLVNKSVLSIDPQENQGIRQRLTNAKKSYHGAFEQLGPLLRTETGKQFYAEINDQGAQTTLLFDHVIALLDAQKRIEATDFLLKSTVGAQDKWFGALHSLLALQTEAIHKAVENMDQTYTFSLEFLIAAVLLAIAVGLLFAWCISRSITQPMKQAVKIAQTVATGDLSSYIETKSTDETGLLLRALQDMNNSLINIVGAVRLGTDSITTAASQIAVGNLDLSSRTEAQASSLEETAAATEELASTVKQNSQNALQANNLATSASEIAMQGGHVVGQVVTTMHSINDSSRKIVEIISVIDGIAFQTNILALNAAVEAARAGEQGRGFAVVASEVRSLAQRSAAAAKEIKDLIGDSVAKVDAGSKLVEHAGATMDEVVASVKRVTDIVGEISSASQEQSLGIDQVNQAISQMDEATQQNAALVEEAAAAAKSLQDQAGKLAKVVSVFHLERPVTAAHYG